MERFNEIRFERSIVVIHSNIDQKKWAHKEHFIVSDYHLINEQVAQLWQRDRASSAISRKRG